MCVVRQSLEIQKQQEKQILELQKQISLIQAQKKQLNGLPSHPNTQVSDVRFSLSGLCIFVSHVLCVVTYNFNRITLHLPLLWPLHYPMGTRETLLTDLPRIITLPHGFFAARGCTLPLL